MGINHLTRYICQIINADRERRNQGGKTYFNYTKPLDVVIDGNNLRKRLYFAIIEKHGVLLPSGKIREFIHQYFEDLNAIGIKVKCICFDSIKENDKLPTYIIREKRKMEARKRLYADVETHDLDGYHLDPLFFHLFWEECIAVVGQKNIITGGRCTDKTIASICRNKGYAVMTGDSDFIMMGVDIIFPFDDKCELGENQVLSICSDNPSFNLEQILKYHTEECQISPCHFFFSCLFQGNDYIRGQKDAGKKFEYTLNILKQYSEIFDSITDVTSPSQMIGKNELIEVYTQYQTKPGMWYNKFFKHYSFHGNRISSIDYRFLRENFIHELGTKQGIMQRTLIRVFTAIEKTECQERINRALFSLVRISSEDVEIDGQVFSLSSSFFRDTDDRIWRLLNPSIAEWIVVSSESIHQYNNGEMKPIQGIWNIENFGQKVDQKIIFSIQELIKLQKMELDEKKQTIRSIMGLSNHTNTLDLFECLIELVENTAKGKVDDVIVNAVISALQKCIQGEEEKDEEYDSNTVEEVVEEEKTSAKTPLIVKDVQITQLYDCYYVISVAYQTMMMMYTILGIHKEELQHINNISKFSFAAVYKMFKKLSKM